MEHFLKPKPSTPSPNSPNSPNSLIPPPLRSVHSHISTFLAQFHPDPAISHFKSHLHSTVHSILNNARNLLSLPPPRRTAPNFCSLQTLGDGGGGVAKPEGLFQERLKGIPVYVLSTAENNMMIVSGVNTGKSLGLLCFKEEDAKSLLEQMKAISPEAYQGSQVVSVGLNQVFPLKVDDVAFRFIPDSHQILNAIKVSNQLGDSADGFSGVPVFLSRSLSMESQNKKYRPAFLRKEDLEYTLSIASQQQSQLNPGLRREDVQVCVLEDIITDMKDNSISKWNDLVFIPPGLDTSKHMGSKGT